MPLGTGTSSSGRAALLVIVPLGLGLIGGAMHIAPPILAADPTNPSTLVAYVALLGTILVLAAAYVLWTRCATWYGASWTGLMIGLGFYGLSLHWLGESVVADPATYSLRAGLTALGGWTLLYPWWALAFGASHALSRLLTIPCVSTAGALLFATILSMSDVLMGDWVFGIPLAPLSSALLDTFWQPILSLGGTHAANGVLGLTGALLGATAIKAPSRPFVVPVAVLGFLGIASLVGSIRMEDHDGIARGPASIYLAQPDAPSAFDLRDDPDPDGTLIAGVIEAVETGRGAKLVVLPEMASPRDLGADPVMVAELASHLDPGSILAIGFRRSVADVGTNGGFTVETYNTVFMIASTGQVIASYDKAHLVPFGEYMPQVFHDIGFGVIAGSGLSLEAGPALDVFDIDGLPPVAILTCYEALLSGPVSRETDGAAWLLNASAEGLFGRTIGPRLLLNYARMRSAETGLPMLRSADTGYTAVIGGDGSVLKALGPSARDGLRIEVAEMGLATQTPFRQVGYIALYISWAVALLSSLALGRRQWRNSMADQAL